MWRNVLMLFLFTFCLAPRMLASFDMESCSSGVLSTGSQQIRVADPWSGYPKYVEASSGDINPFGASDRTGVSCSPLTIMLSELAKPDEYIEALPFAGGSLSLVVRTTNKQASSGFRQTIQKAPPTTDGRDDPKNPDIKVETPISDANIFLLLLLLLWTFCKYRNNRVKQCSK